MKKLLAVVGVAFIGLSGLVTPVGAAPAPTPIVFVGDSITELCNSNFDTFRDDTLAGLAADGYVVDAVGSRTGVGTGNGTCFAADDEHEGKASDDSGEALLRLPGGLAGIDAPDVAFVLLGTNDVQDNLSVGASTANFQGIIAALRAKNPTVHVIVAKIPPYPGKPTETAALNAAIDGLAESGSSPVTIVDFHTGIVPVTHLFTDEIHLNAAGAAFLGSRAKEALIATGRLAQALPTEPQTLAGEAGENTLTVTWQLPADDGGSAILDYSVELTGPEPRSVTTTELTTVFADLDAGTYAVSVTANNANGAGPEAIVAGLEVTDPPPPPLAWAPFETKGAFVGQLYGDFLGRQPDAAGLAYWEGLTADDQSNVPSIIEGFMRSPEFSPRRSVARLYLAFFGRWPDNGGFDFWTQQIAAGGANLDSVSQAFVQSPEFVATYGALTDAEFVDLVYVNVLGRNADQAGYDFWLAEMAKGTSRGRVMTQFSESAEYVQQTKANVDVTVTYRGMLDREPDQNGYDFWVERIAADPNSLSTLISNFFRSTEYGDRVAP